MTTTDDIQKREFERELIQTEALVVEVREEGGRSVSGKTRNISVGGTFIETSERLTVGTQLQIFVGSARSSLALRAMGEVMHVTPEGFGLRFIDVDEQSRQYVQSFINHFRHVP